MRLFASLYDRVLNWAAHRHAPWYLGALSFAESSFFPVPPDVLLAPMTLARPERGFAFAGLTTAASVLGGIAGWAIGYFAFEAVTPLLQRLGYWEAYLEVRDWFETYGFWAVLLAGFSPIPYKLFTIGAGALNMFLPLFVLASLISRGARFYLVASLVRWGGQRAAEHLRRHIDTLGWICVGLAVLAYLLAR